MRNILNDSNLIQNQIRFLICLQARRSSVLNDKEFSEGNRARETNIFSESSEKYQNQSESVVGVSKIGTESPRMEDLKLNESKDEFRINAFNIQMLSRCLYNQLFSNRVINHDSEMIRLAKMELEKYGLPGKLHRIPDVDLQLPEILNNNLEDHFYEIGKQQCKPYENLVNQLVNSIPHKPKIWEFTPGWTKYVTKKKPISVKHPDEKALIFDVEVCCREGENPVLAVAVSNSAWYCWVSEDLCTDSKKIKKKNYLNYTTNELIPLESDPKIKHFHLNDQFLEPKIVIGHHVSYDRARIREQYWLNRTGLRFLDTMSLHICISGVTSEQKMMLKSGTAKQEIWNQYTSLNNSLKEVYKFYCGRELEKEARDIFAKGELKDVKDNFKILIDYCARDVEATYEILTHLWPVFLQRFPHPATLAGILELSTCYLPVNNNWRRYIQDSQDSFDDMNAEAKFLLSQQADKCCQLLHNEKYKDDLWLWDQDWNTKLLKIKKAKPLTKNQLKEKILFSEIKSNEKPFRLCPSYDIETFDCGKLSKLEDHFSLLLQSKEQLPVRIPHLVGYPEWYRKICNPPKTNAWKPGPDLVSTSMKTVPKLLSLTWNFLPMHHLRKYGWCYFVPFKTNIDLPENEVNIFPLRKFIEYFFTVKGKCALHGANVTELYCKLRDYLKSNVRIQLGLIKLPHKDGDERNVGNPLSRDFVNKFSDLEISSSNQNTQRIIKINRQLTYWKNNKDRIENQIVVWLRGKELSQNLSSHNIGIILPQVVVCGTLTRRAVESTWMTASNADSEKIGSELRSMIQAPPGYSIVGADVDSQELWIASLIGDAYSAKEHGCSAFSWMTLSGQKAEGTDMHSVTAKTIGISRNDAKVINYARIYGAGSRFSERLLKQFVSGISDSDAVTKAKIMFQTTKGRRLYKLKENVLAEHKKREFTRAQAREICSIYSRNVDELFERPKWVGGSESTMFNSLEEIACSSAPATPFLGSRLSKAIEPQTSNDRLMPTRINWVVQSSAVDFLHLMLVCMRWLIDPRIRFCLSFHDEVRYLVPDDKKYETALALHVTNLLVRSFFVQRLGMKDLPQSVAFFSSVEIDRVLRKDATQDCVTPSNPYGLSSGYGIPHGESLDIIATIEKANAKIGVHKIKKSQCKDQCRLVRRRNTLLTKY